jgi:hypothetical protein
MKNKGPIQYTIRGLPRSVDDALRRRARREGKSLNATAVETLAEGLGLNGEPLRHHDLDFLHGSWVEDPEFDAAIEQQDRVDVGLWR